MICHDLKDRSADLNFLHCIFIRFQIKFDAHSFFINFEHVENAKQTKLIQFNFV